MGEINFRKTITLGFGVVIAVFTAIIALCVFELNQISHGVLEIENEVIPYELLTDEMAFDVIQVQQFLTDVSATHDREGFSDAEKFAKSFQENLIQLKEHHAKNPDKVKALEALASSFETYYQTGKRMAEVYVTEGMDAGNVIMQRPQTGFDAVAEDLTTKMTKFRSEEVADAKVKTKQLDEATIRARQISIIVGLCGVFGGIGLALYIVSSLINMLGTEPTFAKAIAKEIAQGDLSRNIAINEGDNSSLLFAMRTMQLKLREMIKDVSNNANQIVAAAQHLAESANAVLAGSQRQNDAASGVASAVEEMTASIDQISSNAEHSDSMAKQAGAVSDQGGKVVSDAVEEMHQIANAVSRSSDIIRDLGDSSRKISEIVNVIKDIADQTNLLALNAAIEAARAGEQGRGFAVVADEVRNLAARTTTATQEISEMVEEIQKSAGQAVSSMEQGTERVNEGVAKAQRAGASMAEIKQGTEQVVETVAGITNAIREQSIAVNLVAQEVGTIASMVNDNTLAVDDLAQTSDKLNKLAGALHDSVNHFKA